MGVPALLIEQITEATGLSRQTVTSTLADVAATFGDRLATMRQRIAGIVANGSGDDSFGEVMDYTADVVTPLDKAKIFQGLGLGVMGGFLLAAAAGDIVIVLVALLCLAGAGLLLKSFLTSLLDRAMAAIKEFA